MDNVEVPRPFFLNDEFVFLSPWLKKIYPDFFKRLIDLFKELHIQYMAIPCTNDIWCRDFMPFTISKGYYLQYRYYPDYLLQKEKDKYYLTDAAKVCEEMKLPCITTDIILDGGNMVKAGKFLIMTEKIFKENPNWKPSELIKEIERLTCLKILLLPWDKVEIYGHSDGIVHPINDHKVLMTNYEDFDKAIAQEIETRLKKHFEVIKLQYDIPHPDPRNWAYINYLEIGNDIILPALGIPEDKQALHQIKKIYQYSKNVSQIRMEEIIEQGGALNCITWTIDRQMFLQLQRDYPIIKARLQKFEKETPLEEDRGRTKSKKDLCL